MVIIARMVTFVIVKLHFNLLGPYVLFFPFIHVLHLCVNKDVYNREEKGSIVWKGFVEQVGFEPGVKK